MSESPSLSLASSLSRHARRLAEEKYRTKRDRRSYLEGFASGVQRQAREKVKSLSADSASKYAIVSVKKEDWMLAKYREATGSDGQGKTVTSDTNPHAYFAGQKDGYSAQTEYRQKALAGGGS